MKKELGKIMTMTTLIAKPVVKDQFWVVTDGEKKVGNVIASGSGFEVKVNGTNSVYKDRNDLKKKTKIEFQTLKSDRSKTQLPFANYPTPNKIYNSVLDIKRKLHLFTKTPKSKCYHAASWFIIIQNGSKEVVFCPNYIFIQRYEYQGPFKSEIDANSMINNT